jgi:hypothetical protein
VRSGGFRGQDIPGTNVKLDHMILGWEGGGMAGAHLPHVENKDGSESEKNGVNNGTSNGTTIIPESRVKPPFLKIIIFHADTLPKDAESQSYIWSSVQSRVSFFEKKFGSGSESEAAERPEQGQSLETKAVYHMKDETEIPLVLAKAGSALLVCFHSIEPLSPKNPPKFLRALKDLAAEYPQLRFLYSFRDPCVEDFECDELYIYKSRVLVHHEELYGDDLEKRLHELLPKLLKMADDADTEEDAIIQV